MVKVINKIVSKYRDLSIHSKSMLWFSICGVVQTAITSLTTPIFTRIMSTEEYGQFSIYASWFSILSIFVTLNINAVIGNLGINNFWEDRKKFIASSQILSSVSVAFFLILFLLGNSTFSNMIGLPSWIIVIMFIHMMIQPAYSLWSTLLRFEYKYKEVVAFSWSYTLVYTVIGIIAVITSQDKGIAKICSYAGVQIVLFAIIYLINCKCITNVKDITRYWKFTLKHSIKLIPHGMANQVLAKSDILMINYYVGVDKAGIYSLGYSLAMIVTVFTTGINNALMPWLFEQMKKKNIDLVGKYVNKLVTFILLIDLTIMIMAPEILKIFASKTYYEAINIIAPVVAAVFFIFLYGLFANVEIFYQDTSFFAVVSPVIAVVNIILNALLIPRFGYVMGAYTTLFSYMLYCVFHYWKMKKLLLQKMGVKNIYNISFMFLAACVQIGAMVVVSILYNYTAIRYGIIALVCILPIVFRKQIMEVVHEISNK